MGPYYIKTFGFEFFTKIAQGFCRCTEEDEKVSFLFDIFSKFQQTMNRKAMNDFIDIF